MPKGIIMPKEHDHASGHVFITIFDFPSLKTNEFSIETAPFSSFFVFLDGWDQ